MQDQNVRSIRKRNEQLRVVTSPEHGRNGHGDQDPVLNHKTWTPRRQDKARKHG